jgi:hypothetical protein
MKVLKFKALFTEILYILSPANLEGWLVLCLPTSNSKCSNYTDMSRDRSRAIPKIERAANAELWRVFQDFYFRQPIGKKNFTQVCCPPEPSVIR